jgi:hypothetical protein
LHRLGRRADRIDLPFGIGLPLALPHAQRPHAADRPECAITAADLGQKCTDSIALRLAFARSVSLLAFCR